MSFLFSTLPMLLSGVAILMVGILLAKEPSQSISDAFMDSLAWGSGFLFFFGVEFWIVGIN